MLENTLVQIKSKTITNILKAVGEVADTIRFWVGSIDEDLSSHRDIMQIREKIKECLNPKGGEVRARNNTISLGNLYLNLSNVGKEKFFRILIEDFSTNKDQVIDKIKLYQDNLNGELAYKFEEELMATLESDRYKILKKFISLPNGLKFIVDMREDIINFNRKNKMFAIVESDLRKILAAWFDVGLLDLYQITWNSPASLLEKLILYEAVHEICSWDDLRNRLDSDRRCFAFFHHKMPDEPLIFVEVALTNEIADNIQLLLNELVPTDDPEKANTAIFYSISNTQPGLSGINLGNFLIKRVVGKLSKEFKNIKNYATLSPIPLFMKWLKTISLNEEKNISNKLKIKYSIAQIIENIESLKSDDYTDELKNTLLKLSAYYLVEVKNGDKAYDPVAHFHLSNGASIKRLNWLADTSEKGFNQSAGIMVNYCYELNKIDDNYESYVLNKKINCAKEVSLLLK